MTTETVEVGKTYRIQHSRKGTFTAKIVRDDVAFLVVEVTEGEARNVSTDNYVVGEQFSLKRSHALFTEVKDGD